MPVYRKISWTKASKFAKANPTGRRLKLKGYIPRKRQAIGSGIRQMQTQIARLTSTIETKQAQWKTGANVAFVHNVVTVLQNSAGGSLNPIRTSTGVDDPMVSNSGSRIGDQITIKGLKMVFMFENALDRAKVFYRVMLVRCPRGQDPNVGNGFLQGNSDNRMLDSVNTEKFTVLWQTSFNVQTSNNAPQSVSGTGVPATATLAGLGTKIIKAWVPGKAFGKGGILRYENGSTEAKFYDYRIAVLVYDWFGTPAPPAINNVGRLNEMYCKLFFKDA